MIYVFYILFSNMNVRARHSFSFDMYHVPQKYPFSSCHPEIYLDWTFEEPQLYCEPAMIGPCCSDNPIISVFVSCISKIKSILFVRRYFS